ncbi:hypothetical protein ACUN24_11245 [Pedobacter sp. WC2501]|uniref:hypothetical protein n=1 Tax=Pedobacter sp. WC2501 TaxID=3461400 RepID=UPI004045E09C
MGKKIILISLLLIANFCYAQRRNFEGEKKKIYNFISESVSKIKFKDTTDLYTFAFKINVRIYGENKYAIKIDSNDSLAFEWFPKWSYFKTLDYSSLMSNQSKEITLIVPIVIGTYGTQNLSQKNNLESVEKIKRLFYSQRDMSTGAADKPEWKRNIIPKSEDLVYLFPFISIHDLKTYH